MYTEETFNNFKQFMLPEILRINLIQVVIQLKAIGVQDLSKFPFLDRPNVENLQKSIEDL